MKWEVWVQPNFQQFVVTDMFRPFFFSQSKARLQIFKEQHPPLTTMRKLGMQLGIISAENVLNISRCGVEVVGEIGIQY